MDNGMNTGFIPMPVDLTTVEAASDFPVYPAGPYLFQVSEVTPGTTQKGSPRVSIKASILSGPGMGQEHNGKIVFDGYNLDGKGVAFWKKFLVALGVTDAEMMQWMASGGGIPMDQLVNRQFCALITHREYNGETQNNLKKHRPAGEWGTFAQGAANPAAGAAAPAPGRLQPPPAAAVPPPTAGQPVAAPMAAPAAAPPMAPAPAAMPAAAAPLPPAAQYQQPGMAPPAAAPAPVAPAAAPAAYPAAPPPPGQIPGQGQ